MDFNVVGNASDCPVPGCDKQHLPNLPLLRKIVDEITVDPAHWYQAFWATAQSVARKMTRNERGQFTGIEEVACGSAYCVAGHAAQMTGYHFQWNDREDNAIDVVELDSNGNEMTISAVAMHELGLTQREAIGLFDAGNKLDDVKNHCRYIAERAGEKF